MACLNKYILVEETPATRVVLAGSMCYPKSGCIGQRSITGLL